MEDSEISPGSSASNNRAPFKSRDAFWRESRRASAHMVASDTSKGYKLICPDGGWGWLILLGSIVIHVIIPFLPALFGLLYIHVVTELQLSSTVISWIFNVTAFLWNITGIIVGPLCSEFGWRPVALVGSILTSVSVILTGYAPSAVFIFCSFVFLYGFGGGLAVSVCHFCLPHYFEKRRGFAIATTTAGVSAGQFILPLLIRHLQLNYGYQSTPLIFGAFVMHSCVGAAVFHRIEWHAKRVPILKPLQLTDSSRCKEGCDLNLTEEVHTQLDVNEESPPTSNVKVQKSHSHFSAAKKIFSNILKLSLLNIKLLKNPKVLILSICSANFIIGYLNFISMLPFIMVAKGFTLQETAYCISLIGITNFIGRLCISFLADVYRKRYVVCIYQLIGILISSFSILVFTFIEDLTSVIVTLCFFGFGIGIAVGLQTLVMIEVVGLQQLPSAFGAVSFTNAFLFISIGPLTGFIRDTTNSYSISLWFISFIIFFGVSLWMIMPFIIKRERNKKGTETKNDAAE